MQNSPFDVLGFAEHLETGGFTRAQAEVISKILAEELTIVVKNSWSSQEARRDLARSLAPIHEKLDALNLSVAVKTDTPEYLQKPLRRTEKDQSDFFKLKSRLTLNNWMLALIILVLVVPKLQRWL